MKKTISLLIAIIICLSFLGCVSNKTNATVETPVYTPVPRFGQVKGLITWKYNDFVGIRGDNNAKVMLIPKNNNTKAYDNSRAVMLYPGEYESGILVAKCDGYGNFDFGDRVPVGQYQCLIISWNTTDQFRFNYEESWNKTITSTFGPYFSDEDLETLMLFIGYKKFYVRNINVETGRVTNITEDFGITYI